MLGHFLQILLSSSVQQSTPRPIRFKCPACEGSDVTGAVYDHTEQYKLFHLIPLGTAHSTWVTCNACKLKSRSTIPAAELIPHLPDEDHRYIRRRYPPGLILLLGAGAFLSLFPPIGFIFPFIVLAWGGKYGGWVRRLAQIEIGIGLLMSLVILIAVLLEPPAPKPTFPPTRHASPTPAGAKP